jgi:hypothetical protein
VFDFKNFIFNQSLVGSMVIDVEFGRENYGSISATTIEGRWNY